MISVFFGSVGEVVSGFFTALSGGITSFVALIWDGTALTTFGAICSVALGIGVATLVTRFIMRMIKNR